MQGNEKSEKIINKVNTYSTILLFASIFLEIFFPIFKYVTLVSSCLIYITILFKNRVKIGKFDASLVVLCSISLVWVFLRGFVQSPYVNVLGLVIVYAFLIRSFKLATGKWNRFVLTYGTIAVVCSIVNIYIDSKILDWGIIGLQFFIIFKFLDPILEEIGQAKRRKRLAYEAEQKRLQEEAEKESQESGDVLNERTQKKSLNVKVIGKTVEGTSKPAVIIETEGSVVEHA